MEPARKHPEEIRVVEREADQSVVRPRSRVKKLKHPMLGGLDCSDVPRKPRKGLPELRSWLTVYPPETPIRLSSVVVSFWLHMVEDVLVDGFVILSNLILVEAKQVNDECSAGAACQVATIAIW